jgi:hypothetical protein
VAKCFATSWRCSGFRSHDHEPVLDEPSESVDVRSLDQLDGSCELAKLGHAVDDGIGEHGHIGSGVEVAGDAEREVAVVGQDGGADAHAVADRHVRV